jgi:hypothetical protein
MTDFREGRGEGFEVLCILAHILAGTLVASPAEQFLHGYKHGFCPYALPRETTYEEILEVADQNYDAVGVIFCGPYNGGDIDWSTLDHIVEALSDSDVKTVIHANPRFHEWEEISDVLNTGERITHVWNRNPNYSIIDVFDPAQRRKFYDYLERCAARYGENPDVIGFCILWGYQGETGFYNGDFLTDFSLIGSECAGYSPHALTEYNNWRDKHGLPPLDSLPQPRTDRQSDDYVDWMRFRDWYVAEIFQRSAVDAMKAETDRPIGLQAYLPASPENYARNWCFTPNADFFRSAGSTASYDLPKTLVDSAIGWEDAWLHAGKWDYTFACMRRDEIRQMARGAVFHGMWCRLYETEPQWEENIYTKVSRFLVNQEVSDEVVPTTPTVGLFQPTWATATFPSRGERWPFLPPVEAREHICKMTGLVESFGLSYRLVTEADLLEPRRMEDLTWLLLPMSDMAERFLGLEATDRLLSDPRTVAIPYRPGPMRRAEVRSLLESHGIPIGLDYDGELPICGRIHNLVYNWTPEDQTVRIPSADGATTLELGPHECVLLDGTGKPTRSLDPEKPQSDQ